MNKYPLMKEQTFFQRLFSPKGTISSGGFWNEVVTRLISCLCTSILLCILIVALVPGTEEQLIRYAEFAALINIVLWVVPILVLTRRRLRDGGHTAKAYLWLLLPVVGWIVFLVFLCVKGSEEDESEEHISY